MLGETEMERSKLFRSLFEQVAKGRRWPEAIVAWAEDALGRGVDTPNLRVLAGLARGSLESEVSEYFLATLSELSQPPIAPEERALGVARVTANSIVTGETSPSEGVAVVHSVAVSPLGHPPTLQPWCDLHSGFRRAAGSSKVEFLGGAALDDAIRELARELLSGDMEEQLRAIRAWTTPGR